MLNFTIIYGKIDPEKEGSFNMYDNWEELKSNCMNCRKCALGETRTNLVFGVGNPNAEVLFIGEGFHDQYIFRLRSGMTLMEGCGVLYRRSECRVIRYVRG